MGKLSLSELEQIINKMVIKHLGQDSEFHKNADKLLVETFNNSTNNVSQDDFKNFSSALLNLFVLQSKYTVTASVDAINEILEKQSS